MLNIEEYAAVEKLRLTDEEKGWVKSCLDILEESFAKLSNVDTEGVAPLVSVLDVTNVLRDDVAVKMLSREELLSNAPEQYEGCYQVPKTV